MTTAYDAIAHLSPCVEPSKWLKTQPDAQTAWENCKRGDWMMWLLSKVGVDQRTSVTLACRFARMVLRHTDNHSITAITAAEAWLANPCEDTRAAAAYAAPYAAADAAADAAAYAVDAAYAADAYAADAYAAYTYTAYTYTANAYAEQANIIREIIPVIVL